MTIDEALINKIKNKDRKAMAQAITLLESKASAKMRLAEDLIKQLPAHPQTLKIGVTGPPGVGKSSFIEAFGLYLIDLGKSICALTVDPSSPTSQGSILGDKTRMDRLSRHERAFVRSSPSGTQLGGLSSRSIDIIRLCEAARYDILFIESVGVGQSELDVSYATDITILLIQAAGGDELQGIKKGIVEIADLIVVTKDDGDFRSAVAKTKKQYRNAAHYMRPKHDRWDRKVLSCSAHTGDGLESVWNTVLQWQDEMNLHLKSLRHAQAAHWLQHKTEELILQHFWAKARHTQEYQAIREAILRGDLDLYKAVEKIQAIIHD